MADLGHDVQKILRTLPVLVLKRGGVTDTKLVHANVRRVPS